MRNEGNGGIELEIKERRIAKGRKREAKKG